MRDECFIVHLKGDNPQLLNFDGRCNMLKPDSDNKLFKFYDTDDNNGTNYLLGVIPLENILYIERIFTDK